MQRFTDAAGREWTISLTFAAADEIEAECGIDLGLEADILKLLNHRQTFLQAVVVLIQGQLAREQLDAAALKAAFDGHAWQRAAEALEAEIAFFTPNRYLAEQVTPAVRQRQQQIAETLAEQIRAGQLDATLRAAGSPPPAGASPGSSGSTTGT